MSTPDHRVAIDAPALARELQLYLQLVATMTTMCNVCVYTAGARRSLQVQPKGRAAAQGIAPGDRIVAICGIPTHDKSHGEIKSEMLRAGNDLDLTVLRYCACTTRRWSAALYSK